MTTLIKRILVVEDEAIIRGSLTKLLERHEYEVADAVSVKAAITRFNLNEFDLIISCLLYTSPRPRDATLSRMPSSA